MQEDVLPNPTNPVYPPLLHLLMKMRLYFVNRVMHTTKKYQRVTAVLKRRGAQVLLSSRDYRSRSLEATGNGVFEAHSMLQHVVLVFCIVYIFLHFV